MAKFHRSVPRYTDGEWANLKLRNGYTRNRLERFATPTTPPISDPPANTPEPPKP
jgi:hypothetical protein